MRPLALTWPYAALFWLMEAWVYAPEFRILRRARRAQKLAPPEASDPTFRPLLIGQQVLIAVALLIAIFVPQLAVKEHRAILFFLGLLLSIAGSLIRRHCITMLGEDFRGDVTVRAEQPVIERGAYRHVRHPSYGAAILDHVGVALCFGNWGTLAVVALGIPSLYVRRLRFEERALLSKLGTPYAKYMARTWRLVPGIW